MYTGEDERYVCVTICTDINIHSYINTHMYIHVCVCVVHECVSLVVETEVENILLLHWLSSCIITQQKYMSPKAIIWIHLTLNRFQVTLNKYDS